MLYRNQDYILQLRNFISQRDFINKVANNPEIEMLTTLHDLLIFTRRELENYFNVKEARLIIDACRCMTYVDYSEPKYSLINCILNAIKYRGIDKKYKINTDKFIKKLNRLTQFQAYLVILMVYRYCNSNDDVKKAFNITNQYYKF
ncbi:hypothetical protein SAMN02745135_01688 [Caloranaerobacter azorensis DSM 13643]|uniref:Uncharacterized protein n=1 Tax=Caloranaerobacter azorensis DSM 13643 TaxID=1121264 RepID=A0A1M5V1J3_9FIRM|nr:hypothetical protein [Caloranaerobacter azorensis]SHH68968.1 hypothetical protein SAMN02745135_01688 [Caloranaerobacter azorensis DSM 13643]